MKVGDLIKDRLGNMGIVTEVNKRDLSFYKSHTYLVRFCECDTAIWLQDFELEVVSCK